MVLKWQVSKSAQKFSFFTMLQQPLQSIGSTLPATILVLLIEQFYGSLVYMDQVLFLQ